MSEQYEIKLDKGHTWSEKKAVSWNNSFEIYSYRNNVKPLIKVKSEIKLPWIHFGYHFMFQTIRIFSDNCVSLSLHSKIRVLINSCGVVSSHHHIVNGQVVLPFSMFRVNNWEAEKINAKKSCFLLHCGKKKRQHCMYSTCHWEIILTKFSRKSAVLVSISGFVIVIPTLLSSQLAFKTTVFTVQYFA